MSENLDARSRLLRSGAQLFADKGYKGASVRDICENAGTGGNMIHHYFGNKRGLFDALIEQFTSEIFTVPIRIVEKDFNTSAEFISRFELFVEETLEAIIDNRWLFMMFQRDDVITDHAPFSAYAESLINYLDRGKKAGFINSIVDPQMLTGLVLDRLGNQVMYHKQIRNGCGVDIISDKEYRARWLRSNLDLFLFGLLSSNK